MEQSEIRNKKIVKMRDSGMKFKQIAEELEMSTGRVSEIYREEKEREYIKTNGGIGAELSVSLINALARGGIIPSKSRYEMTRDNLITGLQLKGITGCALLETNNIGFKRLKELADYVSPELDLMAGVTNPKTSKTIQSIFTI